MQQETPSSSHATTGPRKPSLRVRPIEYVLVAVIASTVGIMAVPDRAPDIGTMAGLSQATQLQYQLNEYRSALSEYRADHHSYPGYDRGQPGAVRHGEIKGVNFKYQLLLWSDAWGNAGQLVPHRLELGPYLETGLLKNPINGLETVRLLLDSEPFPDSPNGITGWLFKPLTGELRANCEGKSVLTGQSYYEL